MAMLIWRLKNIWYLMVYRRVSPWLLDDIVWAVQDLLEAVRFILRILIFASVFVVVFLNLAEVVLYIASIAGEAL
jgi:hypothetical protein